MFANTKHLIFHQPSQAAFSFIYQLAWNNDDGVPVNAYLLFFLPLTAFEDALISIADSAQKELHQSVRS